MRRVAVIVLLSITAVAAADKDKPRFAPGPAASYPSHQTLDKITIAAVPYITDAETATVFGKLNVTVAEQAIDTSRVEAACGGQGRGPA